jgi:exodeoxyribonuclease VII large subunit
LISIVERKNHAFSMERQEIHQRLEQTVFHLLRQKRAFLEKTASRIKTPYALYVLKRERQESLKGRLQANIARVFSVSSRSREGVQERLLKSMSNRLEEFRSIHRKLTERLQAATPFSALEKGFAILFHAHDRTLVSPARLPHSGEILLARIPGFEIGLEVRSVETWTGDGR